MTTITILGIGFSIVSAILLFVAYAIFLNSLNKSWFAIASCVGLLSCLIFLQFGHFDYLLNKTDVLQGEFYRVWLFLAPSMFFYFSRAILLPEAKVNWILLVHLFPLLLNFTVRQEVAIPLMFLFGVGYSIWLTNLIYGLRDQRAKFYAEMFFFSLFAVTAICIFILGVSLPYIDHGYFYVFYANGITLAFVLIVIALIIYPELLADVVEVAKIKYAASTLTDIDVGAYRNKLDQLMQNEKLYQNDNLSLALLAEEMSLTPHQLSELVNVEYGVNFSRYVRELRVEAAKKLLIEEPESSVLAIGLETGFKSQSNFYAAFKEITGLSPGAYRRNSLGEEG